MNWFRGASKHLPAEPGPSATQPTLLEAVGVTKVYPTRGAVGAAGPAVKNVSLTVQHGECLGIVGESGSGKTTLANCLAGLLEPTAGKILFDGHVVSSAGQRPRIPRLRGVQIVFQDPVSSLNPRRSAGSILAEILNVYRLAPRGETARAVVRLLSQVGLSPDVSDMRPSRLSGGQQQRVAIARAIAFNPRLIVADEIVSALDASVQAQILNLLEQLRRLHKLSIVLITHDMAVARQLCDRLAVMRQGEIVELGPVNTVLESPRHEYTIELLRAVPRLVAASGSTGTGP